MSLNSENKEKTLHDTIFIIYIMRLDLTLKYFILLN